MTPQTTANDAAATQPRMVLDMVHHNPGEAPFSSKFLNPATLADAGYTGQVFKHVNGAIRFDSLGRDLFPQGTPAGDWMENVRAQIRGQIRDAKAAGLRILYHIDLFVLPKALVEAEGNTILDDAGRISVERDRTLELHRVLFDEMFRDFPEIDGIIIRTGETYLLDTPFHVGNGPVKFDPAATDVSGEIRKFVRLISFLRDEICVSHGRQLIYRTWDVCRDRFHANPDYYLAVTDQIKPHPNLIFSIKHTQFDFFRRVPFNGALGRGKHPQIVEVQCQREYEGKGAHPDYVMNGVINGFEEYPDRRGLKDLQDDPRFRGIYSWSRGGGWYGPYLKNELWCELNAWVITQWGQRPECGEEALFFEFANRLGITGESAQSFRRLCLLSATAVLKGRYCALKELDHCWMRDQNIGGLDQLGADFKWLGENGLFETALAEKAESVAIWKEMEHLAGQIEASDPVVTDYIRVSTTYGRILYSIVSEGWHIMAAGWRAEHEGRADQLNIAEAAARYDALWAEFEQLAAEHPSCATLYKREYWSWPGTPGTPGMNAWVERFRS